MRPMFAVALLIVSLLVVAVGMDVPANFHAPQRLPASAQAP